jgi:hypothetical protein
MVVFGWVEAIANLGISIVLIKLRIPEHPDGNSEGIRTSYRFNFY